MTTANELITPAVEAWIGRASPTQRIEVTRRDIIKYALATEQRLEKYRAGDEAPPMFLFSAHWPLTALQELGPDGRHAEPMLADLPLKRAMAGGVKQRYRRPVKPGDVLLVTRTVTDIYAKQGARGPLIFVVYDIRVTTEDEMPVMQQTLTGILR